MLFNTANPTNTITMRRAYARYDFITSVDRHASGCNIYKIVVYEGSEEQYFTFCTPECTAAIEGYLTSRERAGEKLHKDAPLIREQYNSNDLLKIQHPKQLVDSTIKNKVADVVVRSGVQQKEKLTESTTNKSGRIRKNIPMCHGFRKFTITKMAEADMNYEIRERLSGHTIGVAQRYLRFKEQKYVEEYLKAVDLLTIYEENRLKKTVQELTAKTADNDYIIKTKLEEKDRELQVLKDRLTYLHQLETKRFASQQEHDERMDQSLANVKAAFAEVQKAVLRDQKLITELKRGDSRISKMTARQVHGGIRKHEE
jgi:hypothetical protein